MSQENVEIVRAVYERWSEGDFRAAVELFDPHIVLVLPKASDWGPEIPESGMFIGAQNAADDSPIGLRSTGIRSRCFEARSTAVSQI